MPADALARLFDRFYRVPDAPTARAAGSGVGLSVVRGLVEAMGGTVTAGRQPARRPRDADPAAAPGRRPTSPLA